MITKAPDYVVAEAGDGREALEALERLNRSTGLPDVVLMDVRMQGWMGSVRPERWRGGSRR